MLACISRSLNGPVENTWSESGIKDIYVNTDVYLGVTDTLLDLGNNALRAELVEVPRSYYLKAASNIVSQITLSSDKRGANSGMDGSVQDEVLAVSVVIKCNFAPDLVTSSWAICRKVPWLRPLAASQSQRRVHEE